MIVVGKFICCFDFICVYFEVRLFISGLIGIYCVFELVFVLIFEEKSSIYIIGVLFYYMLYGDLFIKELKYKECLVFFFV